MINCYECVENANTNLIGCKANITLPDGRNISGKVEAVSQNPYSQEEIRAEISEDWFADNVLDGNYSYEVRVIAEEDITPNMLATVIITKITEAVVLASLSFKNLNTLSGFPPFSKFSPGVNSIHTPVKE